MKRLSIWLLLILVMVVMFIPTSNGFAQDVSPITDDQVNELAKDLYCPVCENVPLDVCPTRACAQWRDLIREKMELGWSEKQIKEYFAAQYGEHVLSVPPPKGFNWLIYVLPPLILLIGIAVIANIVIKSKKQPAEPVQVENLSHQPPANDIINEIEQDLRREE